MRNAYRILVGKYDGKCFNWNSKLKWENYIRMDLRERGLLLT
jgi:hypothetical protein